MRISAAAILLCALGLSACQTGGAGGVLGSATVDDGSQQAAVGDLRPGENPNANRRLKNTRNALSDYCPTVVIRAGTETYRVMQGSAPKEQSEDVRYQATITKVARECSYVGNELRITVGARGRVITGPKGGPGAVPLPIRVAVQQGNCSRHFRLTQQPTNIASGSSSTQFQFVDDTISLPAPDDTNVRIFVGFDETQSAEPSTSPCAA